MLEDILYQGPSIKNLIMIYSRPGAQGSAITAFNPLAAQRCVMCQQGFSFLVCQTVMGVSHASLLEMNASNAMLGRTGQLVCLGICTKQCLSFAKIAEFLLHLFQVGFGLSCN